MSVQDAGRPTPPQAEFAVPLGAAALSYVSTRRWPVVPIWWPDGGLCACPQGADCDRPAKHPIGSLAPHGLHDASTDPAVVRAWWRQHPLANIGLLTGVTFDVIDVDEPAGLDIIDEMGRAGYAPTVLGRAQTGRGWHLYVPPSGEGNRARFAPGLDYRGRDGYVVASPSLHASGVRYRWLR
jgi:hypothetical protein